MFCPHCATENIAPSNACISCGKPLTAWTGAVASPAVRLQSTGMGVALPPPETSKMSIPAALGMIAIILFSMIAAFRGFSQTETAESMGARIGAFIGALLLPGAIAYAIAGRKAVRNLNRFALWFCVFGVFAVGNSFVSSHYFQTETPHQRIARLMREAAGAQPARPTGSSRDRQLDAILRGYLQKMFQLNKDYNENVRKLSVSDGRRLNSPESFMDPTLAKRGLGQLHAAYDLDSQQDHKVKELLDNMRRSIAEIGVSDSERHDFLQGFDKGVNTQMENRQRIISAEKTWIQALDDEYTYVGDHRKYFVIQNGHVAIGNETVRNEFNTRIHTVNVDREQFLKMQKGFAQSQIETMRGFGLTREGTVFK